MEEEKRHAYDKSLPQAYIPTIYEEITLQEQPTHEEQKTRAIDFMTNIHNEVVLNIENRTFDTADRWDKKTFDKHISAKLMRPGYVRMVVLEEAMVRGYMVYHVLDTDIDIIKMAVDYNHRRQGIGTMMIEKLKDVAQKNDKEALTTIIRETNEGTRHFLQAHGFYAEGLIREGYTNPTEDGYMMVWDSQETRS